MEVKKKNEREKSRSTNSALGIRCEWWLGVVGGGMDQRLKLALVLDATHDDTLTPSLLLAPLSEMQRLSELDDLCACLSVKTLLIKIVCFHLYVHYTCKQMQRMQVHSYHFVIWCKSAECHCGLCVQSWQSWQLINSVLASWLTHRWRPVAYVLWNLLSFY